MQLRPGVAGLSPEEVKLRPIPGKWSTSEVVCHLADFEIVFADRIKRVIAEHEPPLPNGDENLFAARLAYHDRDLQGELASGGSGPRPRRRHLADAAAGRLPAPGIHSQAGRLTLETLVQRATGHVAHHLKFIADKRRALAW